ncbi:hypothetical protein GCM10007877_33100 [Marinibactrum halimedae]|uniref:Uncharacterized protein n=1 Tax=Marinibactrum halimedae TaxID=1444977 RepID=A0AA37WQ37_9GAMM|nr:hypothetical protein GCM10007877_33100 [Marinibactrum halimedae]
MLKYSDTDIEDTLTLLRLKKLLLDEFLTRVNGAIDYYIGNTGALNGNINYIHQQAMLLNL